MRRSGFAAGALAAWVGVFSLHAAAESEAVAITARQITQFHIGQTQTDFGALRFVGGLEMTASSRRFGALSALRFRDAGQNLVAVADTGFWFFGHVTRDREGRPTGIADASLEKMVDARGRPFSEKSQADAEGLALRNNKAIVSFERDHRITEFALVPGAMGPATRDLPFLVPAHELRQNRAFETVAVSPAAGPLKGSLVAVTEKSLDTSGNIYAAVLDGSRKGVFTVKRHDPFDISDGACLPNGDLLLMERSFSLASGVKLRLRRIPGGAIRPGAVVDGPVLLDADMRFQIDNMEGLDVWRRSDRALMVSMISDDNRSLFQRNLYLEFILTGE